MTPFYRIWEMPLSSEPSECCRPTSPLSPASTNLFRQEMQIPSATPLLRRGPRARVFLTGLHAGNSQQLPGSARLHTGGRQRRRAERPLKHPKGDARHHKLLLPASPLSPALHGEKFSKV